MKCMKRLLAVILGAALLCPMTAYAGQTEEAKTLYDQSLPLCVIWLTAG